MTLILIKGDLETPASQITEVLEKREPMFITENETMFFVVGDGFTEVKDLPRVIMGIKSDSLEIDEINGKINLNFEILYESNEILFLFEGNEIFKINLNEFTNKIGGFATLDENKQIKYEFLPKAIENCNTDSTQYLAASQGKFLNDNKLGKNIIIHDISEIKSDGFYGGLGVDGAPTSDFCSFIVNSVDEITNIIALPINDGTIFQMKVIDIQSETPTFGNWKQISEGYPSNYSNENINNLTSTGKYYFTNNTSNPSNPLPLTGETDLYNILIDVISLSGGSYVIQKGYGYDNSTMRSFLRTKYFDSAWGDWIETTNKKEVYVTQTEFDDIISNDNFDNNVRYLIYEEFIV